MKINEFSTFLDLSCSVCWNWLIYALLEISKIYKKKKKMKPEIILSSGTLVTLIFSFFLD